MNTGPRITISAILYFIFMFIFFSYMPSSTFIVEAGTLADQNFSYDPTADQTDAENIDVFDIFEGLFSFGISGASVSWVSSLLFAYLPVLYLGLGVYCLIRGI